MAADSTLPDLERPAFFGGQRLTAADLTSVQLFENELRWLHNRSLHGWGIVQGLAVTGKRRDREVHIALGYALDCLGRELIVPAAIVQPVPPVAGDANGQPATFFLTASYIEDEDVVPETRAGLCGTNGAVRRSNVPRLRWQNPADVAPDARYRRGLDVILATIRVEDCQLADDVSIAGRRDALPAERPAVACGFASPSQLTWELWPAVGPIGVRTIVTTSDAAFRATPRYEARVTGQRFYAGNEGAFVVDGPAHIAGAGVSSFELRVVLPDGFTAGPSTTTIIGDREYLLVLARIISNPNAWILLGAGASVLTLVALFALAAAAPLAVVTGLVVGVAVGGAALEAAIIAAAAALPAALGAAAIAGPVVALLVAAGAPAIVRGIGEAMKLVMRLVRQRYGNTLAVGQKLSLSIDDPLFVFPVTLSYTIQPHDFDWALADVVSRFQIASTATLRAWNGMTSDADLAITYGDPIVVRNDPIALNPAASRTAAFAAKLGTALEWGVEWIGVEG